MSQFVSRRFVMGGAAVAGLGVAGLLGGCDWLEQLKKKIENRPVRRNVATLDPAGPELTAYKAAVTAMKALPASDKRSWNNQALIHQNSCPHGNWFFLSWHRAYLFAFEAICRELSGDANFALPYWNWQAQPSVPAPFWVAGSPLRHTPRSATAASVIPPGITDATTMEGIQSLTDFEMFASLASTAPRGGTGGGTGELEGTPHNSVHGFVGGTMGTYMSPLDPVFWTHHCMIDACWVDWNIRRNHANTNDANWTGFQFTDFFDKTGAATTISTASCILMPLLSYRYDDPVIGAPSAGEISASPASESDSKAMQKTIEAGGPARFKVSRRLQVARGLEVATGQASQSALQLPPAEITNILQSDDRLILSVGVARPPAENDFFVRVFVGKPDANADTPVTDPHFAGSFAFFGDDLAASKGMEGHAQHMTARRNFLVDISPAAETLAKGGALTAARGAVPLTFVTVPFERERQVKSAGFALEQLELLVSPAPTGGDTQ